MTLFFQEDLGFISEYVAGVTPLMVIVFFGSMQNIFLRGCKFTVFDNTKELAFIPLGREEKLRGKAAIDGVGSRLGKSGGSIVHQGLLMALGSIAASATFVAGILAVAGVSWLFSVKRLGLQFNKLASSQEEEAAREEEAEILEKTRREALAIGNSIRKGKKVSSV